MGESLRQMAGIKYALEDNIKQNFLDPLSQIKDNDLKDVMVSWFSLFVGFFSPIRNHLCN